MLYEKLAEYAADGTYPMHMPGHKRNPGFMPSTLPFDIDITEIHGFDDLHEPHGVLKETSELAARLYGSDKAFLLINGSTVGILAAIGAHTSRGDKILIPRNCHRSVHNAAALFGLTPVIIEPIIDAATGIPCDVAPGAVEEALDNNAGIRLAVVTSPTYEGVVSDVASIADIAHRHGIPLFVDGAHGAHLGFSKRFPRGALQEGADVVVMSLHKTLPALTQCSLLHILGARADAAELARLLSVLQTSSPSYVLMASIDYCLRLLESEKDKLFSEYERKLERFYTQVQQLKRLSVFRSCPGSFHSGPGSSRACDSPGLPRDGFFAFDPGKLAIVTKNAAISGIELAGALREKYKIELELACPDYAVAMTSVCDSAEGFDRLAAALVAIDSAL